jgi:hypothetical protein
MVQLKMGMLRGHNTIDEAIDRAGLGGEMLWIGSLLKYYLSLRGRSFISQKIMRQCSLNTCFNKCFSK